MERHMADSAIPSLIADHRSVEELFAKFEKTTDRAEKGRAELVAEVIKELSIHAFVEEAVLYPRLREEGKKIQDEVLEAIEEHHVVKELLAELAAMDPSEESYEAKMTVLMENVRHHIKEEEGEMFPHAREALTEEELQQLGDAMREARPTAPTSPDPAASA